MPTMPHANAPSTPHGPSNPAVDDEFLTWVRAVPNTFKVLTASSVAVVAFFAPALPEPLRGYSPFAAFMVVVAFLLSWAWRDALSTYLRLVSTGTFVLLVGLIVLQ